MRKTVKAGKQSLAPKRQKRPLGWAELFVEICETIIVVIDPEETVQFINPKGCRILGYPEAEIVGKNWFDHFVPEADRAAVREAFHRLLSGEIELAEFFENSVLARGGEKKTIAWHNTLLNQDGVILGTLSSGQDITGERFSQQALRQREAELRAVVDSAVDAIITIDTHGIMRSFNPAARKMFGYAPEEVIGENVRLLMPEPDRSQHQDYISNYLSTGEAKIIGIGREVMGRRKDGTLFPIHLAVSEVRLAERRIFTGIIRDLTEFKRMQEEILQARNLASIGEMAASIAHEIKNPLAGVSGAVQVLMESFDGEDARRQVMQEVMDQIERLDNSVRQLLLLAKPWKPDKQSHDLCLLIRQVIEVGRQQEAFAAICLKPPSRPSLTAPVDRILLEQVLWNLLHNAVQAMPDGGEIRFAVEREGGFSTVKVTDTGTGIPSDLQERVFRPFFTTKTRGTGLGLPICKKIMDAHLGKISITSEAGGGTEVTLQFPDR